MSSLYSIDESYKIISEAGEVKLVRNSTENEEYVLFHSDSILQSGVPDDYVQMNKSGEDKLNMSIVTGHATTIRLINDIKLNKSMLQLIVLDDAEKAVMFFDFNIDGTWDAKKGVATGNEILFEGHWIRVERFQDLLEDNRIAVNDGSKYQFTDEWVLDQ